MPRLAGNTRDFGHTNPLTTRHFHRVGNCAPPPDVRAGMLRDCPIDHRCMTAISPQEVFERARLLLERKILAPEARQSLSLTN